MRSGTKFRPLAETQQQNEISGQSKLATVSQASDKSKKGKETMSPKHTKLKHSNFKYNCSKN